MQNGAAGRSVERRAGEGTGGKDNNPRLRDTLQSLTSGQADGLTVVKLDRLARSLVRATNIIGSAPHPRGPGRSLVVLDLNLDLTTGTGWMMARTVAS
ncbi:recombinase family protein [Mycobacterium marinum]|uniref:recombinase family protein n=1 Tax=Mycobacterium marinum TaxID=1781 RepID=UPI0035640978